MNIARISYLFRAYFIENKRKLLICCFISLGTLGFAYSTNAMPEFSPLVPYFITFWLAGTFFQYTLRKNNSPNFLNLPVTTAERFIHAIFILLIIGAVMFFLALAGSYIGYYIIHPLFDTNMDEYRWVINGEMSIWNQHTEYLGGWLYYLVVFSTFLFGSVYFKKGAFWKTLICETSFLIVLGFYNRLLEFIAFGHSNLAVVDKGELIIFTKTNILHSSFWGINFHVILIALLLFFLSLTYLRLKETEA